MLTTQVLSPGAVQPRLHLCSKQEVLALKPQRLSLPTCPSLQHENVVLFSILGPHTNKLPMLQLIIEELKSCRGLSSVRAKSSAHKHQSIGKDLMGGPSRCHCLPTYLTLQAPNEMSHCWAQPKCQNTQFFMWDLWVSPFLVWKLLSLNSLVLFFVLKEAKITHDLLLGLSNSSPPLVSSDRS